jgi:hypothetical protein
MLEPIGSHRNQKQQIIVLLQPVGVPTNSTRKVLFHSRKSDNNIPLYLLPKKTNDNVNISDPYWLLTSTIWYELNQLLILIKPINNLYLF